MSTALIIIVFVVFWFVRNGLSIETYDEFLRPANSGVSVESFQRCRYDSDCNRNGFCYGNDGSNWGKCRCKDNYIMNRNKTYFECLSIPYGYGGDCIRDVQCQFVLGSLAECNVNDNTCHCRRDTHLSYDNKCHNTIRLGDTCYADANCVLDGENRAFCVRGKCSCNLNEHPSGDRSKCIKSVKLGDACQDTESCVVPYATCYGTCKCGSGYIESENDYEQLCVRAATMFGEQCSELSQCRAYLFDAHCLNGTCSCRLGYHPYGVECVEDVKVNGICSRKEQCVWDSTYEQSVDCVEGVCTCLEGVSDEDSNHCVIGKNNRAAAVCSLNGYILVLLIFSKICTVMASTWRLFE